MLLKKGSPSFRKFSKYVFIVGQVFTERNKAREDVYNHLHHMRKSIIRMRLSYTDVDRLKEKIEKLAILERKYGKYFKIPDEETEQLRNQIKELEKKVADISDAKQAIINANNQKIQQLTESLESVKSQLRQLLMDKAKRTQRLKALESKIRSKVDLHSYYRS